MGRAMRGFSGLTLFAGAAAVLMAGIVHLVTVLVLSQDQRTNAYTRLASISHGRLLQTIEGPTETDKIFPFRDPAMADAFCLFDLRNAAVDISLPVTPLDVAMVSVYDRHGQAVYVLTNRSALRGVLTLTVVTPAVLAAANAGDTDDGRLRVALDGQDGFVMAEALAATPSQRAAADRTAHRLSCRAQPAG